MQPKKIIPQLYNTFKIILFSILHKKSTSNNKIPFLGVLIDTNNNDRFITSSYKKSTNINPCTINFQNECPFRCNRTIIKTLISRANLLSSSRIIFLNELRNIKQILISNGFLNYIVDTEIKQFINKPEQYNRQYPKP